MTRRHYSEKGVNKPGGSLDIMRELAVPLGRSSAPLHRDRSLTPEGAEKTTIVRSYIPPGKNSNPYSNREPRGEKMRHHHLHPSTSSSKPKRKLSIAGPPPRSRHISSYTATARKISQLSHCEQKNAPADVTKTPHFGNHSRVLGITESSSKRFAVTSSRSVQNALKDKAKESPRIFSKPDCRRDSPVPVRKRAATGNTNHEAPQKKERLFSSPEGSHSINPEPINEHKASRAVKENLVQKSIVKTKETVGKGSWKAPKEDSGRPPYEPKVALCKGFKKMREKGPEKRVKKRFSTKERKRLARVMKADNFSIETANNCLTNVLVRICKVKLPFRPLARNRTKKVRVRIDTKRRKILLARSHRKKLDVPSNFAVAANEGTQKTTLAHQDVEKEKSIANRVPKQSLPSQNIENQHAAPQLLQEDAIIEENPFLIEENISEMPQEIATAEQRLAPHSVPLPSRESLFPSVFKSCIRSEKNEICVFLRGGYLIRPVLLVSQKKIIPKSDEALNKLSAISSAKKDISSFAGAEYVKIPPHVTENCPLVLGEKRAPLDPMNKQVVPKQKTRVSLLCPPKKTAVRDLFKKEINDEDTDMTNVVNDKAAEIQVSTCSVAFQAEESNNDDDDIIILMEVPGKKRIKREPSM